MRLRRAPCLVPLLVALTLGLGAIDDAAAQRPLGEPVPPELPVHDDAWRGAAEARIEEHRKADLEVVVTDREGNPIPDAAVAITMKRHSFDFGALASKNWGKAPPTAEDTRRLRSLFGRYFNTAVATSRLNDPSSDDLLDWLNERDIPVRGHYLMWAPLQPERQRRGQPREMFDGITDDELPERAHELDREKIRRAVFSYMEEILEFAGDRIIEWDAVNHIANANHYRFSDLFGTQIYADVIERGRELAPHAEMWVNEGNVLTAGHRLEKYYEVVSELIELGTTPDGIGFMGHFRPGGFTHPAEVYERLDRFAALVPNLKLTELDVEMADAELRPAYMGDILTVAFSHPAVSGIILWHVWRASAPEKQLWRDDWTITPLGETWIDHVFEKWWTEETGHTDGTGSYATRGFLGDYEITVEAGGETRTVEGSLPAKGSRFRVVF